VIDYAEALSAGAKFPAIAVFHGTSDYWLTDGFHRVVLIGNPDSPNAEHGLRRKTRRQASRSPLI
jgi:hypothetical protein